MTSSAGAFEDESAPPTSSSLRDLQEQLHNIEEQRGQRGNVARALELRALANQHREAFSLLTKNLDRAASMVVDPVRDAPTFRQYLKTHWRADVHLIGTMSKVVAWYIRVRTTSPVYVNRLLLPGAMGAQERANLCEYIEQHVYRPGLEALLRQLGAEDQEPRAT